MNPNQKISMSCLALVTMLLFQPSSAQMVDTRCSGAPTSNFDSCPANLLNNGFEAEPVTDARGYSYHVPEGWTGQGGVVLVQNENRGWGRLTSSSGANYCVLQRVGSFIEQCVATQPGQTYELSFLASSRPNYGSDETLSVLYDGNYIVQDYHPPEGFTRRTFTFVAVAASTTIKFINSSPVTQDRSVFVDDINLTLVNN